MLFDLPDDDTLYRALLARDARYDGHAYVCVASTGIFCRLTCPARKPLRRHCRFEASVAACLEAGFRACKRCRPLATEAEQDPLVRDLLARLEADPAKRWSEDALVALGLDPSTVRRSFQRHLGTSFLALARERRLRLGIDALAGGGSVTSAQLDAGFASAAAFRAAFARLLGCAPSRLASGGLLQASWIATPLGDMVAVASQRHLHLLEFADRRGLPGELARLARALPDGIGLGRLPPAEQAEAELRAFFAGRSPHFATPLAFGGTAFERVVWEALRGIPAGHTRQYGELARDIGRPSAVRAVARANGSNQIALMVPCHRVIGADGALTGYGGGLWRKQRLLEIERGYR